VTVTLIYAGVISSIILKFIGVLAGLRVDEATENAGLDFSIHGK
jgi:Amt family ammonium transporter